MKRVLILGGGLMQRPLIMEAHALGLDVVVADRNPEVGGAYLNVDATDYESLIEIGAQLGISGVVSGGDFAVPAARIAAALQLPGLSIAVAERTHDKVPMKEAWIAANIPTPKALGERRFPQIVKPSDSSASRGITVIRRPEEWLPAFEKAKKFSSRGVVLCEDFVAGPQQSVEMFVDEDGKHQRFGIVDRYFDGVIETGHLNPSELSLEQQEELYGLVEEGARALGITWGPYKADTIWTKDGPMLLEMPARLSGGWHSAVTTPLATGMSPMRATLCAAVDLPSDPVDFIATHERIVLCRSIFPTPGVVTEIKGLEEARALPGVERIELLVKVGDTIRPYENCADRVCYVITSGRYAAQATERLRSVEATLRVVTA